MSLAKNWNKIEKNLTNSVNDGGIDKTNNWSVWKRVKESSQCYRRSHFFKLKITPDWSTRNGKATKNSTNADVGLFLACNQDADSLTPRITDIF